MPDTPVAHTDDLANTEYDAGHRARGEADLGTSPAERETNKLVPVPGTDKDAVVRRETEI